MIRVRNNEIRTYFNKITLTTTSGEEVHYTDTPSTYESMVDKFKHIISCKSELVVLTEEQEARLTSLKTLTGELEEKSEREASDFVADGYISPWDNCDGGVCNIQPLLKLLPKWEGVCRNALLAKYKEILASVRYDRECGGTKFNGMTAFTDKQAQASISSTITMFQVGGIKSTKFKFVDGWQELDFASLTQLGITVATHVQICFNIEEELNTKLAALPFKELAKYKNNPYETREQEGAQDLLEIYNALVDQYEVNMAKV